MSIRKERPKHQLTNRCWESRLKIRNEEKEKSSGQRAPLHKVRTSEWVISSQDYPSSCTHLWIECFTTEAFALASIQATFKGSQHKDLLEFQSSQFGEQRFTSQRTKTLLKYVFSVVTWIHQSENFFILLLMNFSLPIFFFFFMTVRILLFSSLQERAAIWNFSQTQPLLEMWECDPSRLW